MCISLITPIQAYLKLLLGTIKVRNNHKLQAINLDVEIKNQGNVNVEKQKHSNILIKGKGDKRG